MCSVVAFDASSGTNISCGPILRNRITLYLDLWLQQATIDLKERAEISFKQSCGP